MHIQTQVWLTYEVYLIWIYNKVIIKLSNTFTKSWHTFMGTWSLLCRLSSLVSVVTDLDNLFLGSSNAQCNSLAKWESKVIWRQSTAFLLLWKCSMWLVSSMSVHGSDTIHSSALFPGLTRQSLHSVLEILCGHTIATTRPFSWPCFIVQPLFYSTAHWPSYIKVYPDCFWENSFEILSTAPCMFPNQTNWKQKHLCPGHFPHG